MTRKIPSTPQKSRTHPPIVPSIKKSHREFKCDRKPTIAKFIGAINNSRCLPEDIKEAAIYGAKTYKICHWAVSEVLAAEGLWISAGERNLEEAIDDLSQLV